MTYYLLTLAVVAHTYFWGAGITLLTLAPARRSLAWFFAPGLGLALQSAVVWLFSVSGWGGTEGYARWSELLPLVLLVGGLRRLGWGEVQKLGNLLRQRSAWLLLAIMAGTGFLLVNPMAVAGRGVTSSSLGSCDHADYAAGARVFSEFNRDSREGMLGVRGVTDIPDAIFFYDFWLRLNHFTPSALIAHTGSVFGVEAYRLVSLWGVVVLLLNIPMVYLLARAVARLPRWLSGGVSAIYAFAPLSSYAVHQGALGQILAAHGIAVIVVSAGLVWWRRDWGLLAVLVGAFWLLAGSYNFILIVCLVQVVAWLGARHLLHRRWRAVGETAQVVVVAFIVMALLFWPRLDGIAERFLLFDRHNYGWPIPLGAWETWLGLVGDVYLGPAFAGRLPWLAFVVSLLWLAGVATAWARSRQTGAGYIALVLPVVMGWSILAWQSLERANASYDAFKLVSVFYPGLLAGLLGVLPRRSNVEKIGSAMFMAALLILNLHQALAFRKVMSAPPLRVDSHLVGLQRIEAMPQVGSVNVRIDDYWARLWADAFLLRKEHFFSDPAYEGRIISSLKADWDLGHSILEVRPSDRADEIDIGSNFSLVRGAAVEAVGLSFGPDWYVTERNRTDQWRWSKGTGVVWIDNKTARIVVAELSLGLEGIREGDVAVVELGGQPVAQPTLGRGVAAVGPIVLELVPGRNQLSIRPATGEFRTVGGEERRLGHALHKLRLRLRESR